MAILKVFTEHPASVGETWGQHARFAFAGARTLAFAAAAAAVHAIIPALFSATASNAVDRMHARIHGPRGADIQEALAPRAQQSD